MNEHVFAKIIKVPPGKERERLLLENDRLTEKRRTEIFAALKALTDRELEKNPDFSLSAKSLDALVKANPESFPGLTSASSVLSYWYGQLSYLNEKLGLKISRKKRYTY